jgi:Spy/CpxP family protein refolding chaperone
MMISMNAHSLRNICWGASLALTLGLTSAAQKMPGGAPPLTSAGAPRPGTAPTTQKPPQRAAQNPAQKQGQKPEHKQAEKPTAANQDSQSKTGIQFGPVGRWWDNKSVVNTIGLTTDQKRRMDTIFTASKPAIVASYQAYLKEQSRLNSLSHNPQADQASTFAAIDAVNQARSALQKATAQMYLQIRQQMNPEQIQKLEKLE